MFPVELPPLARAPAVPHAEGLRGEVEEEDDEEFSLVWKVLLRGDFHEAEAVVLPAACCQLRLDVEEELE